MRRALAAAAVLALAVAGCSGDDTEPTPTNSTPAPTGETSADPTTSSDPGDEPPVLPDAAKAQTTAGAKAFVRYYADVLNYAWLNLDAEALDDVSAAKCEVCGSIMNSIKKAANQGGYQRGGEWSIGKATSIPDSFDNQVSIIASVSIARGTWKQSAEDRERKIVPTEVSDRFQIIWLDDKWQTLDVSST